MAPETTFFAWIVNYIKSLILGVVFITFMTVKFFIPHAADLDDINHNYESMTSGLSQQYGYQCSTVETAYKNNFRHYNLWDESFIDMIDPATWTDEGVEPHIANYMAGMVQTCIENNEMNHML